MLAFIKMVILWGSASYSRQQRLLTCDRTVQYSAGHYWTFWTLREAMWLAWQAWCGEKTVRLRNCQIVSEGEREGQWDGDSFDYSVSPRRPLRPHPQSWLVNNWLKIAKIIKSNPGKADPYADIDFEEINEQTNLANDEIKCLKVKSTSSVSVFNSWNFQVCFDLFDTKKQEFLSGDDLGDIMRAMGFRHPKFFKGHLSCLHLQNERRISNKSLRHISGLLRRSWLNFCTRLTRTAPERLNLVRTI